MDSGPILTFVTSGWPDASSRSPTASGESRFTALESTAGPSTRSATLSFSAGRANVGMFEMHRKAAKTRSA